MLKQFKFNTAHRKLFITSDQHFSHNKDFIYQKRGFSSVQEHDETLIKRWNERVSNNDDVLCLGDFMLNGSAEKCKEYFLRLNGFIYYLFGNHESYAKRVYEEALIQQFGRSDVEVYPLIWNGKVQFCGNYIEGFINKVPFVASHFPLRVWNYQKHGAIHLHGNEHGLLESSLPEHKNGKILDVGIDIFKNIVSFEEVLDIMNRKTVLHVGHH